VGNGSPADSVFPVIYRKEIEKKPIERPNGRLHDKLGVTDFVVGVKTANGDFSAGGLAGQIAGGSRIEGCYATDSVSSSPAKKGEVSVRQAPNLLQRQVGAFRDNVRRYSARK
jgi:hypothetical protein